MCCSSLFAGSFHKRQAVASAVVRLRRLVRDLRELALHPQDLERDHQPQTHIRVVQVEIEHVLNALQAVNNAVAVHVHALSGQGNVALRVQVVVQQQEVAVAVAALPGKLIQIAHNDVIEREFFPVAFEHVVEIILGI